MFEERLCAVIKCHKHTVISYQASDGCQFTIRGVEIKFKPYFNAFLTETRIFLIRVVFFDRRCIFWYALCCVMPCHAYHVMWCHVSSNAVDLNKQDSKWFTCMNTVLHNKNHNTMYIKWTIFCICKKNKLCFNFNLSHWSRICQ